MHSTLNNIFQLLVKGFVFYKGKEAIVLCTIPTVNSLATVEYCVPHYYFCVPPKKQLTMHYIICLVLKHKNIKLNQGRHA